MLASTSSKSSLSGFQHPSSRCRPVRRRTLTAHCQHQLVLYTKADCPLCDGLKDKVQGLIDRAAFMPSALSGASLEVGMHMQIRDIASDASWDSMQLSVPVLAVLVAKANGDICEVELPRPPPRITADRLERHLTQALQNASRTDTKQC